MKKKLVLGLLVFAALLTITGCGSKKEETSNNSGSNESNNSSKKVASTLTCTRKEDRYEAVMVARFDKDDMIIDGETTFTYSNSSDADDQYKYDFEGTKSGEYTEVTKDGNVVVRKFNSDSKSLSGLGYSKDSYTKDRFKSYWEKVKYECK